MNTKTSIIAKIKELFAQEKMAMDYTAATGEIIRCLGEGLAVGEKVVQVLQGEEGELPDGNYLLDNGKSITVAAGEVKEINDYKAEEQMAEEITKDEIKDAGAIEEKMEGVVETKLADGTEVRVIVAGDQIAVGDKVEVKDAEGNFVNAPEGRHETVDGLILYVDAEGLINEIETKATEEIAEDDKEELKSMFEAVSTLKAMVDELKKSFESMKKENKELTEKFKKFAAEPSAQSITKSPSLSKSASKVDKLKFFGGK